MKGSAVIMDLTPVREDYLKVILELSERNGTARVTDIAERLCVTKATASQTVSKLIAMCLVTREKDRTVFLTDNGRQRADTIRERNLVLKKFLTEILEVDRSTSEKDACMMEHLVSGETIEKLQIYLLNPD
jgi:DtxR family Mn-dependent transcriptional regulator